MAENLLPIKQLIHLLGKVTKYLSTEYDHVRNDESNFRALETTLIEARKLIARMSLSQFLHEDANFQQTLETFINLCYDAEDYVNKVKETKKPGLLKLFKSRKTYNLLQKIKDKLEAFQAPRVNIKDILHLEEFQTNLDISSLFGRENELGKIKQDLISNLPENGVSILGNRGIGKTALARSIYQDTDISNKFHQVWINVNGNFCLETARNKLVDVVKIQDKRLLIIFDNLLFIALNDWGIFWNNLSNRNKDSKVLITTLSLQVSKLTNTKQRYLDPLPDLICKQLIMDTAILHNRFLSEAFFQQETIDELAKKCEGLPLLAIFTGQKLAIIEHQNWHTLLVSSEIWKWENFKEETFPLMKRSYRDMSAALIKGFAYFSLFPHNYEFRIIAPGDVRENHNIDELFQMWESEGFVTPRDPKSNFKKIREDHLNGLLERSLLQCCENGKVFKLQRIGQKIAEVASSKTCLRFDREGPTSLPENTRHLSLLRENLQILIDSEDKKVKRLRTILSLNDIILHTDVKSTILPKIFQHGSRLRVLSFNGIKIQELSSSIKSLIHLRYLDVSGTLIGSLPKELAELSNLLFLKLSNTRNLHELPENFHKLTNLQCIGWDIGDIQGINPIPNIGCLSKLQTLPLFRVGNKEGFRIGELQKMEFLQNSICVRNLENVESKKDAEQANLHEKKWLEKIELQWKENNAQNIYEVAAVLTGLKPHDSLSKLKITNYSAQNFPDWISDSEFKLVELHLYQCGCESLPALGQLQALKKLVLESMNNLHQVDENFCRPRQKIDAAKVFPSLESLAFIDMAKLQRWINLETDDDMPLHDLQIESCPKMIEFPSHVFTSLQHLTIIRCKQLDTLPNVTNLSSTSTLIIRESDKLKEKWKEGGEAWSTVNKFQSVMIDDTIPTTPQGSGEHHQNIQQTDEDNEVTTLSGALPPDWFSSHWLIHINFGGIKLIIFILAIIVLCVAIKWI